MTENAFTPALKWAIAGLTVLFLGLGTWLGVVVYQNAQGQPTSQRSQAPAAPTLPEPVTTVLEEPKEQPKAAAAAQAQPVAEAPESAAVKSERQEPSQPSLAATVSTSVAGSVVTVQADVNRAATAWFSQCRIETPSGSGGCTGAATKPGEAGRGHTLSIDAAGASKLVAELSINAGGERRRYDVVVDHLPGSVSASAASSPTQSAVGSFAATASITTSNGQSWLTVTASEAVRIGVDSAPSDELATTHRRAIAGGSHTVTAQTADGREQRFTVSTSSRVSNR